jgi:hypothetical protein
MNDLVMVKNAKNKREQKTILNNLAKQECFFRAMKEISINIIKGRIPIKQIHKAKFGKTIKALACGDKGYRKKHLLQSGGFITTILPILASVLGPAIGGLINGES